MKKLLFVLALLMLLSGCSSVQREEPAETTATTLYYGTTKRTKATLPEPATEESDLLPPEAPEINFTGLTDMGAIQKQGNIPSNLGAFAFSGLVCPDEERSCTYISAIGYDNLLHKFVDGKDEGVIFDKTVWAVNVWDGMIYCLADSDEPVPEIKMGGFMNTDNGGDIYRINPDTKETEFILDSNAVDLYIADGVLYYTKRSWGKPRLADFETFTCSLSGENSESLGTAVIGFCGKYLAVYDDECDYYGQFLDTETGERIPFTDEYGVRCFSVSGDKAYYCNGDIFELNLITGEERNIEPPQEFCNGYAVMGDDIYCGWVATYIVSPEFSREQGAKLWTHYESDLKRLQNDRISAGYYEPYYTDGERIYVMKQHPESGLFMLVQLEYDHETMTNREVPIL
ncbi:MAG: DUF5050 domain-containing protein [Ruminiclostridium sp.]|nr:DUF5050 domain-containing protein [Ruminiclostridium sp.]